MQHREEKGVTWRKVDLSLLRDESSRNSKLIRLMATAVTSRVTGRCFGNARVPLFFSRDVVRCLAADGISSEGVVHHAHALAGGGALASIVVTLPGLVVQFLGGCY